MDVNDIRDFLSGLDREMLLDKASEAFFTKAYLQTILEEVLEDNNISLDKQQKEILENLGININKE